MSESVSRKGGRIYIPEGKSKQEAEALLNHSLAEPNERGAIDDLELTAQEVDLLRANGFDRSYVSTPPERF